jgi:hypothetical protein
MWTSYVVLNFLFLHLLNQNSSTPALDRLTGGGWRSVILLRFQLGEAVLFVYLGHCCFSAHTTFNLFHSCSPG